MIDLSSIPEWFWFLLGLVLIIVACGITYYLYGLGKNELRKLGFR